MVHSSHKRHVCNKGCQIVDPIFLAKKIAIRYDTHIQTSPLPPSVAELELKIEDGSIKLEGLIEGARFEFTIV